MYSVWKIHNLEIITYLCKILLHKYCFQTTMFKNAKEECSMLLFITLKDSLKAKFLTWFEQKDGLVKYLDISSIQCRITYFPILMA